MDGNEKLQKFHLYIHGAVDGFSRKVMYLRVANNKKPPTVASFFKTAVLEHGFPKRVRSDKGGENVDVALIVLYHRGVKNGAFIVGRSVHNERIERLWREVNRITQRFKRLFNNLLLADHFDLDNHHHVFFLHYLFIPQIQKSLNNFALRWGYHKIRTAHFKSPNELYISGQKAPTLVPSFQNSHEEVCQLHVDQEDNCLLEFASHIVANPLDLTVTESLEVFKLLCEAYEE